MAPIRYVNEQENEALEKLKIGKRRFDLEDSNFKDSLSNDDFIYVPSIDLYVAKERKLLGENWFDSQKELHSKNEKMLTIPEFLEFLKYTKKNYKDIYKEITEVKSLWRAEWLDADFKVYGGELRVNYHMFQDGKIIQKSEVLDKNTLMNDPTPGISLEGYLTNSHTSQGLPSKDVKKGDLHYKIPRRDNNSVARFDANNVWTYFSGYGNPSNKSNYLGVRVAKQRE